MSPNRFPNTTHEGFNVTLHTALVVTTKLVLPTPAKPILPVQTGEQAQQEEQSSGMTIFFSLLVLGECRNTIVCHLECLCVLSVCLTPFKRPFTLSSPSFGVSLQTLRDSDQFIALYNRVLLFLYKIIKLSNSEESFMSYLRCPLKERIKELLT